MTFTSSGIGVSVIWPATSGVTSVTYPMPASASPDITFVITTFTSSSFETTFASVVVEIPAALEENGLSYVRPGKEERDQINRIIMEELVSGIFKPEAVEYFQGVMNRLKDQGCDAVVLGCTEIPLIMNDRNSPLPTLDSTRLLARAALQRAIAGQGLNASRE